jgi:hypothetical protein
MDFAWIGSCCPHWKEITPMKKQDDLRLGVLLLPMTRYSNIIKIRCVLHHFNIVFGDTLTYNDIQCGIMSGNITFIVCVGSQLWDRWKVKADCHTVVNNFVQYSNLVYVPLVVTCISVLMANPISLLSI